MEGTKKRSPNWGWKDGIKVLSACGLNMQDGETCTGLDELEQCGIQGELTCQWTKTMRVAGETMERSMDPSCG